MDAGGDEFVGGRFGAFITLISGAVVLRICVLDFGGVVRWGRILQGVYFFWDRIGVVFLCYCFPGWSALHGWVVISSNSCYLVY